MNPIAQALKTFNAGRDPERLALKWRKMREDAFVFLRGSCHLFYARLPSAAVLQQAPATWVCGDLHLENFGSYKGDNRLCYFDINDFDEACLAPCSWDLLRFLCSIHLGSASLGVAPDAAKQLGAHFLDAYAAALASGKARWLERETADGLIRDLLDSLRQRERARFLDSRSERQGKRRRLRLDKGKALPVSPVQREQVSAFLHDFAAAQPDPGFFAIHDVARRIAGTGSLGVERYIVLVEGKGGPEGQYLLDLKQAQPSSLPSPLPQPHWRSEAERVVSLQSRLQAISMAFLHPVEMDGQAFVLRGLQPSEDRVDLAAAKGKGSRLAAVLGSMGQILAWDHLRSSGRSGSANADELIDFGQQTAWRPALLQLAEASSQQVRADWQDFARAFDAGYFA